MYIKKLTKIQSFATMQRFLDQYYWKTLADDVGAMLGRLMFLSDNRTTDLAVESDWIKGVKTVITNYDDDGVLITINQTYEALLYFLKNYYPRGVSSDLEKLIDRMALNQTGQIIDIEIREFWNKAVDLAISEGPMYLQLGPLN